MPKRKKGRRQHRADMNDFDGGPTMFGGDGEIPEDVLEAMRELEAQLFGSHTTSDDRTQGSVGIIIVVGSGPTGYDHPDELGLEAAAAMVSEFRPDLDEQAIDAAIQRVRDVLGDDFLKSDYTLEEFVSKWVAAGQVSCPNCLGDNPYCEINTMIAAEFARHHAANLEGDHAISTGDATTFPPMAPEQ